MDRVSKIYEAIAAMLVRTGAIRVFAVAGTNNFRITEALKRRGVEIVAARHEGNAASMAGASARLSRGLGILSVSAGPGLTNAITGIGEAAKNGTGLLVLAGDVDGHAKSSSFSIDQAALAQSVGAVSVRLTSVATALEEAAQAISLAREGGKAVVLSMPLSIQYGEAPNDSPSYSPDRVDQPRPSAQSIDDILTMISTSKRPLILAGRGAVLSGAGDELQKLAKKIGAITATTLQAYGLFADDPFDLGVCGGFSGAEAAKIMEASDLVLGFGTSFTRWTTRHGTLFRPPVRTIQIDICDQRLGMNFNATKQLHADAALTARALNERLSSSKNDTWRGSQLADEIQNARPRSCLFRDTSTTDFFDPRKLSLLIDEIVPRDRTLVLDAGHFMGWTARYIRAPDADGALFGLGFQSIGLGLGAGIAAALTRPDRLAILCTGDGGYMMSLADIETAVRLGIRLGIVIYDDAAYGAEVHPFGADGLDTSFVKFPDIDLAAPAIAFGAQGGVARCIDDLCKFATWCADPRGVFVLDAKIDPVLEADWHIAATRGPNH